MSKICSLQGDEMTDDELGILLKDKTDFNKRLRLIASLYSCEDERSVLALKHLAKHDFVYVVRRSAWQALQAKGILIPEPVERPRYVILLERFLERAKRICQKVGDFCVGWSI